MSLSLSPPTVSSDSSPYDEPNFEENTTQKMAHYYIVAEKCLDKLHLRHSTTAAVTPHWKAAEQAWHANPTENPCTVPPRPHTLGVVHAFYKKCDVICNSEPNSTAELIRVFFAANNGAQFILNTLSGSIQHPLLGRIARRASKIALETLHTPEELRAIMGDEDPIPTATVCPGDILRYRDAHNANTVHTIRIKDHGSSSMRGEYFIVTTIIDPEHDDDTADQEVPNDVMAEWVSRTIA